MHENNECEFKEHFSFNKTLSTKYCVTINAFLNTSGGKLYFGVRDNGLIVVNNLNNKYMDEISLFFDNLQTIIFKPPVYNIKTTFEKLARNNYVIVVNVPKSNEQIFYKNCVYIRCNSSNRLHYTQSIVTEEQYNIYKTDLQDINKRIEDIDIEKNVLKNILIKERDLSNNKSHTYSYFTILFFSLKKYFSSIIDYFKY